MITTIARKSLMALTGLFLCLFLVIHLGGNLQLFLPGEQARLQFNWYADTLSHSLLIEAAAIVTYVSVLAHSLLAISITIRNRSAVGVGYQSTKPDAGSTWYSRFMGVLGFIILVFLIVHMSDFWFPFKTGADFGVDRNGHRDLFALITTEFQKGWKIALYEVGVLAVGFHVAHGVYSGLRSLGVYHPGYARILRWLGFGLAGLLTIGFGSMPIYIYFTQ